MLKINAPVENIEAALTTFTQSLKQTLKNGFSKDQIDRIRKQYIASKIYEKETLESYAFSLGYGFAQTGDIHCEENFINQMKLSSKEDVHKALLEIFSRQIHINIQLPDKSEYKLKLKNFVQFQNFKS